MDPTLEEEKDPIKKAPKKPPDSIPANVAHLTDQNSAPGLQTWTAITAKEAPTATTLDCPLTLAFAAGHQYVTGLQIMTVTIVVKTSPPSSFLKNRTMHHGVGFDAVRKSHAKSATGHQNSAMLCQFLANKMFKT